MFDTASPALIRQFCENLKRQVGIGPKVGCDMSREATIERLMTAVQPHPDLGKPSLWSLGARALAIKHLPWPLPMASEIAADAVVEASTDNVVSLAGARA